MLEVVLLENFFNALVAELVDDPSRKKVGVHKLMWSVGSSPTGSAS